jgi:hypothetical protein
VVSLLTNPGTSARERGVLTHQANLIGTQRAITHPGAAFQSRKLHLVSVRSRRQSSRHRDDVSRSRMAGV